MIQKILFAIASFALAFSIMAVGAQPASAGTCSLGGTLCGTIRHYAPDTGHDAPITIRCHYGVASSKRYVHEGESSKKYCKDTDQVYVHTNEEIWCLTTTPEQTVYWFKKFDATGWHKITDAFNRSCVVQRD